MTNAKRGKQMMGTSVEGFDFVTHAGRKAAPLQLIDLKHRIPTIEKAKTALAVLREQFATEKSYAEIQKGIREAKAIKLLFQNIAEVRYEAEDTIIVANRRVGQECTAVKNAPRGKSKIAPQGHFRNGKDAIDIPGTTRRRLQRLAVLSDPEIERFSISLREEDREVTVKSVLSKVNEEKSELRRAARRKSFEDTPALGDNAYDYRVGRAQDVLTDIKEMQPRLILTDPPYEEAADPLFDWLFRFAEDVLPVGASLITFTGHHRLPRDFAIAAKYKLRWWWELIFKHNESRHIKGKYVIAGHKPILWFVKDKRYNNEAVYDVLTSEGGRDKDGHEWGQGDAGIVRLIDALTEPGDLICEPFCGEGRWGRIAVAKKRRWIGCDVVQGGSSEVIL